MSLIIGGYKFILPIILALILVIFVWFLLTKTTLGYKVKTVGLNPFAADYAGISRRKYAFISFTLSGALAGVMAVIYYVGMNPSLSFATDDLPAIGFDSISVALVGQISAFGVIGSAFLWGLIKSGGPIGSVGLGIPNAVSDIIFGVIIYSAACAILLSKLEPIKFLTRYFNVNFNKERRINFYCYWKNIWNEWIKTFQIKKTYNQKIKKLKKQIKNLKTEEKKSKNQQIKDLKQEYKTKINKVKDNKNKVKNLNVELQTKIKKIKNTTNPLIDEQKKLQELMQTKQDQVEVSMAQIHQEFNSMKNFLNSEYDKIWTSGKFGINNKATLKKKTLYGENLNEYINSKISYEERIHNLTNSLNNDIRLIKQQSSPLLSVRIKDLKQEYNNQVKLETSSFNKEFQKLISKEKQKIANINKEWKSNRLAYKKTKAKGKR